MKSNNNVLFYLDWAGNCKNLKAKRRLLLKAIKEIRTPSRRFLKKKISKEI